MQIEIVCARINGFLRNQRLAATAPQLHLQLVGNRLGDFILDREDAGQLAVVFLRPQVIAAARVDQLRGDAHFVAGFLHAAFQHGRDIQHFADLAQVLSLALEREGGSARSNFQVRQLRQRVENFLGHVDERQHRNGLGGQRCREGRAGRWCGLRRAGANRLRGRCSDTLRRVRATVLEMPPANSRDDGDQHADQTDRESGVARRQRCPRLDTDFSLRAHDALRRSVERPRQHQHDREAEQDQQHHRLVGPVRQVEHRKHLRRHLDQQPADNRIRSRHAIHVATLQFTPESPVGHAVAPIRGSASSLLVPQRHSDIADAGFQMAIGAPASVIGGSRSLPARCLPSAIPQVPAQ